MTCTVEVASLLCTSDAPSGVNDRGGRRVVQLRLTSNYNNTVTVTINVPVVNSIVSNSAAPQRARRS